MIFYTGDEVCEKIDEAVQDLNGDTLHQRIAEILGTDDSGYPTCSALTITAPTVQEIDTMVENIARHGDWCRKVADPHNQVCAYSYTRDEDRVLIADMIKEDAANHCLLEMSIK